MERSRRTGVQIAASPATSAALQKGKSTSSAVMSSAVLFAELRPASVTARLTIASLTNHAPKSNQSMKPTAPLRSDLNVIATTPARVRSRPHPKRTANASQTAKHTHRTHARARDVHACAVPSGPTAKSSLASKKINFRGSFHFSAGSGLGQHPKFVQ
jgi:hypothetical protein